MDCTAADAVGVPHFARAHPTTVDEHLPAQLRRIFPEKELWPMIAYGNPGNSSVLNDLVAIAAAQPEAADHGARALKRGTRAARSRASAESVDTRITVLTATSGPPVRCGAVRCGRRRSSDLDDRRVGLSPGARNTTESASSRAHTVQ